MKTAQCVGAAVLAVVLGGFGLGVAEAKPKPATCSTGVIETRDVLKVRSGPGESYQVDNTIGKGERYLCDGLSVGERYSDCGWTEVNGWIRVFDLGPDFPPGYVKSVCAIDV